MLQVETKRTTQQEQESRQDRGFKHVGADMLSLAFRTATFGIGPKSVMKAFKLHPTAFEGMTIPDGFTLPNIKNVLAAILIKEQEDRLRLAL